MFRWNDDFWRKHNQEFAKGKEDFIARVSGLVALSVSKSLVVSSRSGRSVHLGASDYSQGFVSKISIWVVPPVCLGSR